jgi:hypothetical protein
VKASRFAGAGLFQFLRVFRQYHFAFSRCLAAVRPTTAHAYIYYRSFGR